MCSRDIYKKAEVEPLPWRVSRPVAGVPDLEFWRKVALDYRVSSKPTQSLTFTDCAVQTHSLGVRYRSRSGLLVVYLAHDSHQTVLGVVDCLSVLKVVLC